MTHFAALNASGGLAGFYSDGIHEDIPDGAIALTDIQYSAWVIAQSALVWADGALVAAPVVPLTTAQALAALDLYSQAQQATGVLFQASGASAASLFATDAASRNTMVQALLAQQVGLWTDGTPWKTASGYVPLTGADVVKLAHGAFAYVAACATREAALAASLEASPSADITTGWPSNQVNASSSTGTITADAVTLDAPNAIES